MYSHPICEFLPFQLTSETILFSLSRRTPHARYCCPAHNLLAANIQNLLAVGIMRQASQSAMASRVGGFRRYTSPHRSLQDGTLLEEILETLQETGIT